MRVSRDNPACLSSSNAPTMVRPGSLASASEQLTSPVTLHLKFPAPPNREACLGSSAVLSGSSAQQQLAPSLAVALERKPGGRPRAFS
jgi:hypothetical protein